MRRKAIPVLETRKPGEGVPALPSAPGAHSYGATHMPVGTVEKTARTNGGCQGFGRVQMNRRRTVATRGVRKLSPRGAIPTPAIYSAGKDFRVRQRVRITSGAGDDIKGPTTLLCYCRRGGHHSKGECMRAAQFFIHGVHFLIFSEPRPACYGPLRRSLRRDHATLYGLASPLLSSGATRRLTFSGCISS